MLPALGLEDLQRLVDDVHDFLLPHLLLPQESVDLLLIGSLLLPLILIVVMIALRMPSHTALL